MSNQLDEKRVRVQRTYFAGGSSPSDRLCVALCDHWLATQDAGCDAVWCNCKVAPFEHMHSHICPADPVAAPPPAAPVCGTCGGTGERPFYSPDGTGIYPPPAPPCDDCNGTGKVIDECGTGTMGDPACEGTGQPANKPVCQTCGGRGGIRKQHGNAGYSVDTCGDCDGTGHPKPIESVAEGVRTKCTTRVPVDAQRIRDIIFRFDYKAEARATPIDEEDVIQDALHELLSARAEIARLTSHGVFGRDDQPQVMVYTAQIQKDMSHQCEMGWHQMVMFGEHQRALDKHLLSARATIERLEGRWITAKASETVLKCQVITLQRKVAAHVAEIARLVKRCQDMEDASEDRCLSQEHAHAMTYLGQAMTHDQWRVERDTALERVKALEPNARRYEWLRDEQVEHAFLPQVTQYKKSNFNLNDQIALYDEELDAAIDAAISAQIAPEVPRE